MAGRVSLQTFLGNCLEEIAALAFDGLSPRFERSPAPPSGLISPDFFREGPTPAFAAVTSTPTRNTFQKKKWRYIHEVFSLKQFYAESDPVAINIQLSPPGALQPLDEQILRQFFDVEVRPEPVLITEAVALLEKKYASDHNALSAVRSLAKSPEIIALADNIRAAVRAATSSHNAANSNLWKTVRDACSFETRRAELSLPELSRATCLRDLCFGLLVLPPSERKVLVKSMQSGRPLPPAAAHSARTVGFELGKSVAGPTSPGLLVQTVKTFGQELVLRLCADLSGSEELQHIIADLTDPSGLTYRIQTTLALLASSRNAFVEHVIKEFKAATDRRAPKRLLSLDYALLLAGLSITEADKWLANEFGDLGAANRIQCMISARCQGRFSFKETDTHKVASRLFDRIRELRSERNESPAEELARIFEKRTAALSGLGGEANPVEMVFKALCVKAGVRQELKNLPCLLTDRGLRGRGVAIERIYELRHGDNIVFTKVLSGYQGGFEHKSEELSGRSWLLRYRQDQERVRRDSTRLVFVCEGEWDKKAIEMLLRSGWDDVILCIDLLHLSRKAFVSRLFGPAGTA